jgi:hypothetical protein
MNGDLSMIVNKALIAAAVLLFTAPMVPALAHDDYGDHAEHWQLHRDLSEAHRRAHEEGFYSSAEHNAYHRALRDLHQDFHEDHPGNWHDHYGWRRYYGGWGN